MPIVGLNLAATKEYESEYDSARGTNDATKFKIGTLDSRVQGYLRDMSTKFKVNQKEMAAGTVENVEASMAAAEVNFATVQFGLKGWTNFRDSEGSDIGFETRNKNVGGKTYKVVAEELVAMLPVEVIIELAGEIKKVNTLEEVVKNV